MELICSHGICTSNVRFISYVKSWLRIWNIILMQLIIPSLLRKTCISLLIHNSSFLHHFKLLSILLFFLQPKSISITKSVHIHCLQLLDFLSMFKHFSFLNYWLSSNLSLTLNKSFHMFFDKWLSNNVDNSRPFFVILLQEQIDEFLHVTAKGFR